MNREATAREGEELEVNENWSAVWSLALSVFGMVTAELLPVSLLTPMASDLGVSEGLAGQAVTATAVAALVSSLVVAALTRRFDRRAVLLAISATFVLSNLLVGFAPNYAVLLAGRVLQGLALGAFWSMAAAVTMRLVPKSKVPRALSIVFAGVSVALAFSAPAGSYLGGVVGWRWIFLATAGLGVGILALQLAVLPTMKPTSQSRFATLFVLLRNGQFVAGISAMILVWVGTFALFTYLRPLLETRTQLDLAGVSVVLLVCGVTNIVGTFLSGTLITRNLRLVLAGAPLAMGFLTLGLGAFGGIAVATAVIIASWGLIRGMVPVSWTTWVTQTVPDEMESAGGLQVAAIQLGITGGAGLGGLLMDHLGASGLVIGSGGVMLIAAILVGATTRQRLQTARATAT